MSKSEEVRLGFIRAHQMQGDLTFGNLYEDEEEWNKVFNSLCQTLVELRSVIEACTGLNRETCNEITVELVQSEQKVNDFLDRYACKMPA